jgi:hypothetical protein
VFEPVLEVLLAVKKGKIILCFLDMVQG